MITLPLIIALSHVALGIAPQSPVAEAKVDQPETLVVDLAPATEGQIGWSPKTASISLAMADAGLTGEFTLGPKGNQPIRVLLSASQPEGAFDTLSLDSNRDGTFAESETLTTKPTERRGKIWSSFKGAIDLKVTGPDQQPRVLDYPVSIAFVSDPSEPDAKPVLRWSRSGWMVGHAKSSSGPLHMVMAEFRMDGIFNERDRWAVGADVKSARRFRDVSDHNWCGEQAWRVVEVHPSGLQATLQRFDPGMTRAEEADKRDRYRKDRRAARAKEPLKFGHDFAAAETESKDGGKRLFLDFEATWCGPCKMMDNLVYTAQEVVDAAAETVCVKLDGDVEKELVKRFKVTGYPTLILLDETGAEVRRVSGYQSVAKTKAFLR